MRSENLITADRGRIDLTREWEWLSKVAMGCGAEAQLWHLLKSGTRPRFHIGMSPPKYFLSLAIMVPAAYTLSVAPRGAPQTVYHLLDESNPPVSHSTRHSGSNRPIIIRQQILRLCNCRCAFTPFEATLKLCSPDRAPGAGTAGLTVAAG